MTQAYLDIHNATVFRGDTRVFEDLTLAFHYGQSSCILGPNGAGKSTLLKLLTRELYPVVKTGSYVKIDGSETAVIWELRQKIGLVSQDLQNQYDAHVSGRDVVMSGLFGAIGLHGHFDITDEHHALTDAALQAYDLAALQSRRYWHLSTGQQRKFLLARAMIHKPKILILDEPTNGLDVKASFELLETFRTLAQSGTTLLLATHHIHEILPEIERVILLKEGRVVGDGPKLDTLTERHLRALYDTPLQLVEQGGHFQVFPGVY